MGLDCSHDAFHGAYSSFNRFRKAIAAACGGSWPPHDPSFLYDGTPPGPDEWCWDDGAVPAEYHAGLLALMEHSDCEGELTPDECRAVAAFLRWVAPRMTGTATGHLSYNGETEGDTALVFADGCDRATEANEPLVFG